MANDADWVADVRRWYFASQRAEAAIVAAADDGEPVELGYEAAHPALQSHHWPDAPHSGFTGPK